MQYFLQYLPKGCSILIRVQRALQDKLLEGYHMQNVKLLVWYHMQNVNVCCLFTAVHYLVKHQAKFITKRMLGQSMIGVKGVFGVQI